MKGYDEDYYPEYFEREWTEGQIWEDPEGYADYLRLKTLEDEQLAWEAGQLHPEDEWEVSG